MVSKTFRKVTSPNTQFVRVLHEHDYVSKPTRKTGYFIRRLLRSMDAAKKAELLAQAKLARSKSPKSAGTSNPPAKRPLKKTPSTTEEFPKTSGWAIFWYVCAILNFLLAVLILFADLNEEAKMSYFIVLVVNGLLGCFFGYMTQLACHIRWLLAEQLRVAKVSIPR